MSVVKVHIPRRKQAALVGKGGSTIKELQSNFNVKINTPGRDEVSTEVLISGKPDDIERVRAEMEKILGIRTGTHPLVELEISVAPNDFKIIIGRGGDNLRNLEAKFGVSIHVPRQGDASQFVLIEGTNEGVHDAFAEIKAMVNSEVKINKTTRGADSAPAPAVAAAAAAKSPAARPPSAGSAKAPAAASAAATKTPAAAPSGAGGEIDRVLFFPDKHEAAHNMEEFLATLKSAKSTLDVCVFTITDDRIANALLSRHASGVKLRVITDNDQSVMLGSDIVKLKEAGVPVKMDVSPFHMHHKFAVIDQQLLINGSFNWTRGASRDNCENVMITNNKSFVSQFHNHFAEMWADTVNFK